jgi:hypothetical protein
MGCDIHAHTEVKINGVWHHYSTLHIRASYALFSRMANVRNDMPGRGHIDPISEPRGLPEDISFITKFDNDLWGTDGHSNSWLSGAEMEGLEAWWQAQSWAKSSATFVYDTFGYLFGNGWYVSEYPDDHPEGVEDARVVFWFDN